MVVHPQRMKINPCLWTMGFFLKGISYLFAIVGIVISTLAVQMYMRHKDDPELQDIGAYWFEIVFASMGALAFLIGATGIAGADCGSQCCLGLHVTNLIVLALLEVVVILDWKFDIIKEKLPEDPTEEELKWINILNVYEDYARTAALVLLCLQVCSLIFALLTIHLEGRMRLNARQRDIEARLLNGNNTSSEGYQWQKE